MSNTKPMELPMKVVLIGPLYPFIGLTVCGKPVTVEPGFWLVVHLAGTPRCGVRTAQRAIPAILECVPATIFHVLLCPFVVRF